MICIEEQSIATFWGALRLCQIVNDMSFWADRILKPKVSMYIDQWRSRHMHGLRVDLSGDSLLSDVVQKVEQREKDLGLPRTSNLVEIVRLALIISEIPSAKKDTKSKEDINPQTNQPGIPVNKPVTPVSYSRTEETAIQSTTDLTESQFSYQKTPSGSELTMTQKSKTMTRKPNTKTPNSKSSTNTPTAQKKPNNFALGGSVPQNVAFGGTGNMGGTPSSWSGVFDFEATLKSMSLSTPSPTPPSKSNPIAKESLAINGGIVAGISIAEGGGILSADARTKPSTKKYESIFDKFLDKGSQKTSNLEDSSSDGIGVNYKVSKLGISGKHQDVNPGENTKARRADGPHSGSESDNDERLSMIAEDTLLFLWPEA